MILSGELEAPPGGWGRCGEIQGLSRPFGDIGNMGYHAVTCPREICCSRLKFHKGILNVETMMRILIKSAGALCAYTSWGDRLLRMATLLFGSHSRAEWSLPPTAIVSLV